MTERQEELAAGWMDGSLSEAEQTELLEALRSDPAFAEEFARELEIHRGLRLGALQGEAGDLRATERILHYVRASQEPSQFMEGIRRRVVPRRSGPSAAPFLVAAALLLAAVLGLLLFGSGTATTPAPGKTAERRRVQEPIEIPKPVIEEIHPVREVSPDDAKRKEKIEEELRAATQNRPPAPPQAPESRGNEKPVAPETPSKPPAEKPAPPEKATQVEAATAVARIEAVKGEFTLHYSNEDGGKVVAGANLLEGAELRTLGPEGMLTLRFPDGSRVDYSGSAGDLRVSGRLAGKKASGRGVTLGTGTIYAEIAKQPAGQSFLVVTPHAEVQVVGTRFTVHSPLLPPSTFVEVKEGQVRVSSLKGTQTATLGAGQGAEVGTSGALRSHYLGLRAVYFDQNTFKGPTLERVEPEINLVLDQTKNEIPPIGQDRNFGVRWEGQFLAETAAEYVFHLAVDGKVRFSMDGQELFADPKDVFHGLNRTVVRRRLTAGWHDFLLEYSDDQGNSRCVLRFAPPGLKADEREQGEPGIPIPPRLFTHRK